MNGIQQERLLIVAFAGPETLRRAEKVTKAFLERHSNAGNGFAVRLDSVGFRRNEHVPYKLTQVVLTVWYPTDDEADAPVSIQSVKDLYKSFVADASRSRNMSAYFATADAAVSFDDQLTMLTDEVVQARRLYMYKNNLQPGELVNSERRAI
jgi:hypothetical protein